MHRRLVFAAVALAVAARAYAQESPPVVALAPSRCAPGVVDGEALTKAVRADLTEKLGQEPTIADTRSADYRIELDCATPGVVLVKLARTLPPARESARVAVAGLDAAARPGVIAHEVGELVRRSMQAPTAPTMAGAVSPEVAAAANAPPAPRPDDAGHQRRLRLTRDVAIVAAAVTVTGVVIGAPLLANGDPGGLRPRTAYVGAGGALLALAGASLVTTVVSFALWLGERHRAQAR